MLKRNWNWKNNRLFCLISVIGEISIGADPLPPHLGYAYAPSEENKKGVRKKTFEAKVKAFEASRPRSRPRTSKCVVEDSTMLITDHAYFGTEYGRCQNGMEWNGRFQEWNGRQSSNFHTNSMLYFTQAFAEKYVGIVITKNIRERLGANHLSTN